MKGACIVKQLYSNVNSLKKRKKGKGHAKRIQKPPSPGPSLGKFEKIQAPK